MRAAPDHISPSQIGMFRRCPRQWYHRYIEGIIAPPSISLVLGSAYHTALETNFKQKISSQEDLPVADVQDAFVTSWDYQLRNRYLKDIDEGGEVEYPSIAWEDTNPEKEKDKGCELVSVYQETMAPSIFPMEVEEEKILDIGGVKVVMRIDLITDNLRIVDHKTSSKSKTQDEMEQELQPAAYGLAVKQEVPFDFHVAVKTKVPKIQVVTVQKTFKDFAWFAIIVSEVAKAIKAGVFPPNDQGWWCSPRFCGYYSICKGKYVTRRTS